MQKCQEFKCRNCGECCGAIPIRRDDRNKIRIYLLKHPEVAEFAMNKPFSEKCVFRNDTDGKCMIYECRPEVCRLFKCNTPDWYRNLNKIKVSEKDIVLINERFGNPEYREKYAELRQAMIDEMDFINRAYMHLFHSFGRMPI